MNFFFIAVLLRRKVDFWIMELIVSFPNDIEVSLIRNVFWKLKGHPFVLITNSSFSSNTIFSSILLFLFERCGLHAFQNGLELQPTLSLLKHCNLSRFFRFATRFCCRLNLAMSTGFFWLISLVFETWSDRYLFPKVLIKMRFLIPS